MAAKASASAFNSFFYQQQQEHQKQHSNVINNNNSSKMDANGASMASNSEPVLDLHLKMSKKIAQLTKVSDLILIIIIPLMINFLSFYDL